MKLMTAKEGLKYSVIVVSYNTVQMTARCIESICKHTKDFEIIVVDNASKDGSVGYLNGLMSLNYSDDVRVAKGQMIYDGKDIPLKIIYNEENRNFGPANNQGLDLAEGERIILLNSDAVATPDWAERLEKCLIHRPDVAIVGPVSNNSNGRQQVRITQAGAYPLENTAIGWANDHGGKWLEAGILYGWCMMICREFLETVEYLFDERFINSFDDNDLCLRARYSGWKLFIDYGTYIHHEGQASFKKALTTEFLNEYMKNGIKNQDLLYDKYKPKENPKLIAVYRIANCEKYVGASLAQTSKFADEIICLFARSQDRTKEIALSFPKVTYWQEWSEPDHPFDEQAERDWLTQEAIRRGADWIISIDGDEIYEDKFIQMVPRLIRNPNPHVLGYWCNWRTIWDTDENGQELFRSDDTFGAFQNYRFFKVIPGMKIETNSNIYNHHCGSAPQLPTENIQWLNVRVKHLGYDSREQREKKFKFYQEKDPRPVARDVGHNDYRHLIDRYPKLKPYKENNRVSVMTICKDEENFIFDMLLNVEPVADEFIIVDTGSTDGTLEQIARFARKSIKPVTVYQQKFECDENGMLLNYSEAKNWAKGKCQYEWILAMDADEVFVPEEVSNLFALLDEDVDGYLISVINYLEPPKSHKPEENHFGISESFRLYKNIDEIYYSGLIHESLEDSVNVRCRNGKGPVMFSPIRLHHRGYLKPKDKVREKVDRYFKINQKQFEISGEADARAPFNMAMHYLNDGDLENGLKMYELALKIDPDFWRCKQNMAYFYLDKAKKLLNDAFQQMPPSFRTVGKLTELVGTLNSHEFLARKVC